MAKKRQNPIDRTDARVDQLAAMYARVEAELTRLIFGALISGKTGSKRYRNQKRAVARRMLLDLEKASVPRAAALVRSAYNAGESEARRLLGAKPVSARKTKTVKVITENLTRDLGKAHTTVGRNVDDVFRKETLRVVQRDLGNTATMANQLADRLAKQGLTGFVDKAGRRWTLANYAKMAVVTTAASAVNVGTVETMSGRDLDLVEINKVVGPCKICLPHEGQIYSISGNHPKYAKLDPVPPYHPGPCRHYASPSKLAIADRRARQGASS